MNPSSIFFDALMENEEVMGVDINSLVELCTWFPISPNFKEWPIEVRKKGHKFLFYKVSKKQIAKRMLGILLRPNGFGNIAFPIVRRTFTGLMANELVSVQPMSKPVGSIFYLDYKFNQDISDYDDDEVMHLSSSGTYGTPTK